MPCRCSSQLSYSPIEFVISGKVNRRPLPIFGRVQAQLHLAFSREQRLRQKVATVVGPAVNAEKVDLARLVARAGVAARRAPGAFDADDDHRAVPVGPSPFALDPKE